MFKRILTTLICFSFLFLATACQAEKEITMPDKPLEISLNISTKELYKNNSEYKKYQSADAQPMGVAFQGYDFPRSQESKIIFKYPNGEFQLDGVMSVNSYDNVKRTDSLLTNYDVTFIYSKDSNGITDEEAYKKTMAIFEELKGKGWVYNKDIGSPRLYILLSRVI